MKLFNLGSGGTRKRLPWINMDLDPDAKPHIRDVLDKEENYVEHDMTIFPWPFEDNYFNGVLASHILEHFDCHMDVKILNECKRILKPGGIIRISIPAAEMFRRKIIVGDDDWGGQEAEAKEKGKSFLEFAMFFCEHVQILSYDSIWCFLKMTNFKNIREARYRDSAIQQLTEMENRPWYSIFAEGTK